MSDQGREEETRRPRRHVVIGKAVDAALRRLPRAMPARVTSYDSSLQRASCKVLVQRPYFDEDDARQIESIPVVPGVPVVFPGAAGSYRLTFPISDGSLQLNGQTVPATTGLLIWCDRSLDRWLSGSGAEVDPELDHANALADAIFIPGLNPFGAPLASAPTDRLTLGRDQSPSDVEIDGSGNINLANGSNGAARIGDPSQIGTPLATWMSQVETAINTIAPGSIAPLSSTFLTSPGITIKSGSSKVKIG